MLNIGVKLWEAFWITTSAINRYTAGSGIHPTGQEFRDCTHLSAGLQSIFSDLISKQRFNVQCFVIFYLGKPLYQVWKVQVCKICKLQCFPLTGTAAGADLNRRLLLGHIKTSNCILSLTSLQGLLATLTLGLLLSKSCKEAIKWHIQHSENTATLKRTIIAPL